MNILCFGNLAYLIIRLRLTLLCKRLLPIDNHEIISHDIFNSELEQNRNYDFAVVLPILTKKKSLGFFRQPIEKSIQVPIKYLRRLHYNQF